MFNIGDRVIVIKVGSYSKHPFMGITGTIIKIESLEGDQYPYVIEPDPNNLKLDYKILAFREEELEHLEPIKMLWELLDGI